jgi:hypothetical protein
LDILHLVGNKLDVCTSTRGVKVRPSVYNLRCALAEPDRVPPERDEPTPMEAYPVSTRVGNVKNTDAGLIEPLEVTSLA